MAAMSCVTMAALAQWQPVPAFALELNKESGVYAKGEKVELTLLPQEGAPDSLYFKIYRNNAVIEQGYVPAMEPVKLVNESFSESCAMYAEVSTSSRGFGAVGKGFAVAPEEIEAGYEEPADLMQYWMEQKRRQAALPMDPKLTPLQIPETDRNDYVCYDVELNALGPRPARAYFAKPVKAAKKSLPIVILCRAAGVSGDWCRCQVGECLSNAKKGEKGALSLDLNAHGMLNGQPNEYYTNLEKGELNNYYHQGIESRETYYFYGMYMRLLRAIEFMAMQPEWDGERILVIGESQGGGQASAAAGLDSRVSAVVLNVPAMMDFGAYRKGRRGGWPQPYETNLERVGKQTLDSVLPYFDAALLLKNSDAEIICELGLIDTTCPATSVYSGLNNAIGEKIVNAVSYRQHSWPSGQIRPEWEKKYLQQRLDFIDNYLK